MLVEPAWWHWIIHILGLDTGSGHWYLFWSGAGSNVLRLSFVVAAYHVLRQNQCHTKHCWRVGRFPVLGTPYTVCAKCHHAVPNHGPDLKTIYNQHLQRVVDEGTTNLHVEAVVERITQETERDFHARTLVARIRAFASGSKRADGKKKDNV